MPITLSITCCISPKTKTQIIMSVTPGTAITQQVTALREQTRLEATRILSQKFGFEMPTMEEMSVLFGGDCVSNLPVIKEKPVKVVTVVKEKKEKVVKEKKEKVVKEKKVKVVKVVKVVKEKKVKKVKMAKPAPVENKPTINMPWCGKAVDGCCGALIVNGGLYTQCFKEIGSEATYCKKHDLNRPAGTIANRMKAGVMNFSPPDGKKVKPFSCYMSKNPVTRQAIEDEASRLGWTIDTAQWEAYVSKRGRPKKNSDLRSAAVTDTSDESGNESLGENTQKKVMTEKSVPSDFIAAKIKESLDVEEKIDAVVEKIEEKVEKIEEKVEEKVEEEVEVEEDEEKTEEKTEEKIISDLDDLYETEHESDSEGIDCEEWEYNGVDYGVDIEGNVYNVDLGDKVGIRKEVNGEYELVMDEE